MATGNINVSVENIFPLIKKFLYSDHEIFLRELISNATDATLKLKHLARIGEANVEIGKPIIEIKANKEQKTLHIIDQGIGMTKDEVEKYINEVAFSGAEEFLDKYKDSDAKDSGIIGHFGLGFYSAFMVANKVEIFTKSWKDEPAAHWTCEGTTEFTLESHDRTERGTEIVLHINDEDKEFLEDNRINELLNKYNKFMPVPIKFGTKEKELPLPEDAKEDEKPKKVTVDHIINNPNPAWTKQPTDLNEDEYNSFYRELYPMQFEEPLFHIHLNVDYPFNLTGILYFPKLTQDLSVQKDKIQLYQNQVFVTDNVEGIVPEFLTMLRGVIDSPDIPLNVSRSYLQADGAVKKISNYITKKVADKLKSLFKNNREDFEKKWNDIKVVIEYGMLTDDKFFEKAEKFNLFPSVDQAYYTFEELEAKIKENQTDKDDKLIILYASNKEEQHSYIEAAKDKGYEVMLLDSPIVSHLIQKIEGNKEQKVSFVRVDAEQVDKLIDKGEETTSKLNDDEKEKLKTAFETHVTKEKYTVQLEAMDSKAAPITITEPEFMRRMKEMQKTGGGGMFGMGNMPEMYNLVVNTNHELMSDILQKNEDEQANLINQSLDLALLSKNLLRGEALTKFVKRSYEMIK
ncbi:molecular chaperone HtpG [Psychroflexus salis]|uniref:Chaperone protein HtpG n=1 Tax=Psychroflexus salis TaxID=1526574 RepID=A0A917E8G1_9FLAO|nr:molecular chaperone HtpG [Psychroflexus salis]GGE15186.1 chaperone protein HtpG [Psychroflexus salis]